MVSNLKNTVVKLKKRKRIHNEFYIPRQLGMRVMQQAALVCGCLIMFPGVYNKTHFSMTVSLNIYIIMSEYGYYALLLLL